MIWDYELRQIFIVLRPVGQKDSRWIELQNIMHLSHVNRKKWTAKDVKKDLPKKRGRKPSKSKSKSKRQKKGR